MYRTSFNAGWVVRPRVGGFEDLAGAAPANVPVTLPHDALLMGGRSADSPQGAAGAYFEPGVFQYEKTFDVPETYAGKRVVLQFEGVYRDAMVYINRDFAAQRPSGYATFAVRADPYLRYGEVNTVRVEARTYRDSRWYAGAGMVRDVWLAVGDLMHIALDSLQVRTPDVDGERAVVCTSLVVQNEGTGTRTLDVELVVRDPSGDVVATDVAPVTVLPGERAMVRQRLYVCQPELWSTATPRLYTAAATLRQAEEVVDEERTTFGIRTLQLDPVHGLRINGETVKLRGACIHADNGVLGAAAIGRAEERKVQLLREAGFNAIRSAHNPLAKATLDACDRLGVLVMDETFDIWTEGKSPFDYSLAFPTWWEEDVAAMVTKDFNHPSVIFYSIGNEIFEVGSPVGSRWGRLLAEKVRSLDDTRFVTNAINGGLSVMSELPALMGVTHEAMDVAGPGPDGDGDGDASVPTPGINTMLNQMAEMMDQINASALVTERTAESFAVLDVAGINYGTSRYLADHEQFPNRILVGSETFPTWIAQNWELVSEYGHIIGDFTWTGWDYLGEAGIGRPMYPADPGEDKLAASYPWLLALAGDIDITGQRRTVSYYRETVFGLRDAPFIAVQRPEHHDHPFEARAWAWTDSIASWTWEVPPGSPIRVEVYSDADEVELVLNGQAVGRSGVGDRRAFVAEFDLPYEPGVLEAIAYRDGAQAGRSELRTAGDEVRLQVAADRAEILADEWDLAFVRISLVDGEGVVHTAADRAVTVVVQGPGVLQGLGSARPATEESFLSDRCTTYDGRALAVVRPAGSGEVTVTASAPECERTSVIIRVMDQA